MVNLTLVFLLVCFLSWDGEFNYIALFFKSWVGEIFKYCVALSYSWDGELELLFRFSLLLFLRWVGEFNYLVWLLCFSKLGW